MSQVTHYSRSSLYEQYKKTDPKLAKKFLGEKYKADSELQDMGGIALAASILNALMLIGIIGVVSNGFGPTPLNPSFYSTMFSMVGGVCGPFAAAGLVMIAIGYCKKRHILAEKLSVQEINSIAGKILMDSRPGTMGL